MTLLTSHPAKPLLGQRTDLHISNLWDILSLGIGPPRSVFVKFYFKWFDSVFSLEEDLEKQTKHLNNVNIHN